MKMKKLIADIAFVSALGLLLVEPMLSADGTRFSDFTPLTASATPVPVAGEATPISLGNSSFQQRSIADRATQLALGAPNSGAWDMITANETGPHKGRFLFTVFETGQGGVQRHDLWTGQTETIWISPTLGGHISFDPSFWTPWGTLIVAEEAWATIGEPGYPLPYGRLFELKNPTTAPAIFGPPSAVANVNATFIHQNVIPRTSHEGIQFDRQGNLYFIDELNGGNLYKYTTGANFGHIMAGKADYFAA